MSFITSAQAEPVRLKLARDHSRWIKQGYPWIYADWLSEVPQAAAGSRAFLRDKEGALIAFGMYDAESPIAMRVCALGEERLDDNLIMARLTRSVKLRRTLFDASTTGFRLINGEGDGLPGLVCDLYEKNAVLKLDGAGPGGFWDLKSIAEWLRSEVGVKAVLQKFRSSEEETNRLILGELKSPTVQFLENGLKFQADIDRGQKSGFFFDQRDNRARIGRLAKGRTMLNLFGYTGGFSVYAGVGGAKHVITVDLAKPAIAEAQRNWTLNGLPENCHNAVAADAFKFLEQAASKGQTWELIVVDPPSFAPAEKHLETAKKSYESLFVAAMERLSPDGIIALSSCSSHITEEIFLEICKSALSKARLRGSILGIYGQPEDHPFPFVCKELRYLKFVIMQVI